MEIIDLISKLESSICYKEWTIANPGFYLVHMMFMARHPPQIGYYNAKLDRIATFDVTDDIVCNPISEVFKDKKRIDKLDMKKVKIDKKDVLEKIETLRSTQYPKELIDSDIMILQNFMGKTMYNTTYFTKAFKTLNIKVDATTGEIISHDIATLVSF
jgi:hypothetical protein